MRVLLDENLNHALRKLLSKYKIESVAYLGWTGLIGLIGRGILRGIRFVIIRHVQMPKLVAAVNHFLEKRALHRLHVGIGLPGVGEDRLIGKIGRCRPELPPRAETGLLKLGDRDGRRSQVA